MSNDSKYDYGARVALLAIMASLCAITWGKWGDLLVDSFHEFYVPAAILAGKRLYFDVWYPYGPLIPHWHALLFRLFGPHVWVLEAVGISIVAGITWLTYSLARLYLPISLAFAAGFAYLLQAFEMGEFNYVLPYSYPAAYGALLFVLMAWLLVNDPLRAKRWTYVAASLLAGLEALTKIEFGVAAFALVSGAVALRALRNRSWAALASGAECVPGVLLCAAVYGWYIKIGGLNFLFGENISILPDAYFTRVMGSRWAHVVGSSASPIVVGLRSISGVLGVPLVVAAIRFASTSRLKGAAVMLAAAALAALNASLVYAQAVHHVDIPRALLALAPTIYFNPGMVLSVAILLVWSLWTWRRRRKISPQEAGLLLLLLAGILLASRTIFLIRPQGYSIFYDVLVFVGYLVVVWKAAGFLRVPDSRRFWTWTSAALCCGLISLTFIAYRGVLTRSFRISVGSEHLYVSEPTGTAFQEALEFLKQSTARSEKFVAWPEEVAFHYFTGTTAPSRWWALTPGILPAGETTASYLAELDAHNVKYVALSNRYSPEYGMATFGVDYNQQVYEWLTRKFRVVRTFGDYQRVNPQRWAVQIWERQPNESRQALNPVWSGADAAIMRSYLRPK